MGKVGSNSLRPPLTDSQKGTRSFPGPCLLLETEVTSHLRHLDTNFTSQDAVFSQTETAGAAG